ncbi:MAG: hypothetical protein ACQEV7_00650 [Bacillota bacterium]
MANEEGDLAVIKETVVDQSYELLDKKYDGKKVLSVEFKEKENAVVGPPIILDDPVTIEVIGFIPSE